LQWKSEQGPKWLHFDYTNPEAAEWISNKSGLDEVSASALFPALQGFFLCLQATK
jgi:hypothetical protein